MASTQPSVHVHGFWSLIGLLCVISMTALLHAQAEPDRPSPTTRSSTTQSAGVAGQPSATTRRAAVGEPRSATTQPVAEDEAKAARAASRRRGGDPEPRREPSPTEILRALTEQENAPGRPIVRPTAPGRTKRTVVAPGAIPPNVIGTPQQRLMPDGYRLVDRPGRLAREGYTWVFTFESRSEGRPELPIRLLPNRLLEDMEMFSDGGIRPVVFVVSGEVTEYHNVNYLLVQKLLTRPDLGNLE
jgi:hypothetical protein